MSEIVDRLIHLVRAWYVHLMPWVILGDDEVGLLRRLGKYHRDMVPGWNWKIPVIEQPMRTSGALESVNLQEQTLTTSDDVQLSVGAVLSYRVINPRLFILACGDANGLLNEVVMVGISSVIPDMTAAQVLRRNPSEYLRPEMERRARTWGVEFVDIGLVTRARCRTYRLIQH